MDVVAAVTSRSDRQNDDWVRELRASGPVADRAQQDLRVALVRGLRRMLSSRGVAEDLCEDFAQDALVRVRDRLDSFRGESRFTTWALAIATRLAFDELRHKRWRDVSFESLTADAQEPIAFVGADATGDRALSRERVLAALREVIDGALTVKQRAVLVAELGGMPQSEIALQLGMSRNALYKLSHDARKRVKVHLEERGIVQADVLWVFD